MEKKSELGKLYEQHISKMSQIALDNGIYKISDFEIDKMYEQLIACLPNHGKLYKYRNFQQESFEKSFASLLEGYIWLASPCFMNDKIDTTLKLNVQAEKNKIKKFLNDNKYIVLKKWLELLFENNGIKISLSDEEVYQIVNCYTKQGRAIRIRIQNFLCKYGIPYNKFNLILEQVVYFIEKNSIGYKNLTSDIAEKFVNINIDIRKRQRLFCVAESPSIDSMWAYYGDNNRGFCIEYDFNKAKHFNTNIKRVLLNLFQVKYRNKRFLFCLRK